MGISLEGIKVIQPASAGAAPMAGKFLADWGADVICVEHTTRKAQSKQKQANRGSRGLTADVDYSAQNINRNKRGITLNLATEEGLAILHELLDGADVMVTNFRPRELKKFKLEYETLSKTNPRIICGHLTGWGRKGADADKPAYGPLADARSGILHVLQAPGTEPPQMSVAFADYITGMSLALGIMTALFLREKTGIGQEVDVSLLNTLVWVNSFDVSASLVTGKDRQAVKRRDRATPTMNTYKTKDGRWLFVAGMELKPFYWSRFCNAIGRPDLENDERFEKIEARRVNDVALFDILEEVFLTRTFQEWKDCFSKQDFPWAPLQNLPEVCVDPQAIANDYFVPVEHPKYGTIKLVANPIKLSKTPHEIRTPAPEAGQHNEEVLSELGYGKEDIEGFREKGVIL
ncbi:CaiB/BaiF CoA transferase family protein [Thermodesulfobacteriota bacterium]